MPPAHLRDARLSSDLEQVLAINQANVPHVSGLTHEALRHLGQIAASFRVVEADGVVAAFLIALSPEAPYESVNFQWFRARYPSFLYVDRIAVASAHQRAGLGSLLYRDVVRRAEEAAIPIVTCEINVRPPNAESLAFHDRFGFREVGQQDTEGGTKRVSLRLKALTRAVEPQGQ